MVAPVRVLLEFAGASKYWPAPVRIALENVDHAVSDLFRHLEGIGHSAIWSFYAKAATQTLGVLAQRFHDQVGGGKPNGPPPVGVAAFQLDIFVGRYISHHARAKR